jgi:hypothetical protein
LPSSEGAKPRSRPSGATQKIIGELGLRYRPSASADLEAHAATLALLCQDLADIPPHLLERATRDWAVQSPYLPKASDLVAACQALNAPPRQEGQDDKVARWKRRALEGNRLAIQNDNHGSMHWIVSPAGFGTEIVHAPMPSQIYSEAMEKVDPAVFDHSRGNGA